MIDVMREVIRRTKVKLTNEREIDPIVWIEFYCDDSWELKFQNRFADDTDLACGSNFSQLSNYLEELRNPVDKPKS